MMCQCGFIDHYKCLQGDESRLACTYLWERVYVTSLYLPLPSCESKTTLKKCVLKWTWLSLRGYVV
jgi:hypothetical protein